jgi:general secretion pathway protein B
MSLILEALRKSEAERQLGRAPGLMTPMLHAPRRRGWLWPLLLVLPILLLAGAAGWWFGRGGGVEPDSALSTPTETQPIAQDTPSPAADSAPNVTTPPSSPPPSEPRTAARSAAETATPAPANADEGTGAAAGRTTAERVPTLSTPAAPVATAPAGDPAGAASAPLTTTQSTATAQAAIDAATDVAATDPAREAAPTELPVPAESLPTLPMLEPALRDGLPPLRMSMHGYAGPVDQRFVLIDGRRYAEGQAIDQRLQVDEIRRDGVVLTVDGRRFLLPRS